MKALIWILSFFLISILNAILGYALGFKAGYVIIYLLWFFIAKKLCKKWDKYKAAKATRNQKPSTLIRTDGSYSCPTCDMENSSPVPCERCGFDPMNNSTKESAPQITGKTKESSETNDVSESTPIADTSRILFCRMCGEKLIDHSVFCNKCGTKVVEKDGLI